MKKPRAIFKPYHQNQLMALPPTFDELISVSHPVRVVNQIIDQINLDSILNQYKGGGCSSYHPRMLLKVLVFGYLNNIYSSRRLESAIRENIYFMWLSGMQKPDHNTINRFRCDRLSGVIKDVFSQVVLLMVESGHLDLQSVYTDGTKIESFANRYTFVWRKTVNRSRARIESQLEELWNYAQSVAKEELSDNSPSDFSATDPQAVKDTIERIDEALRGKDVDKKTREKIKRAKKNWPNAIERYNRNEQILQERNSYSKTDPDATFMRMKEDHMGKGQPKPGYNVQLSTHNQIIANYTIHQNPADPLTLKPHVEAFEKLYGILPKELTADAGYGTEQNYQYLQEKGIVAYVKYPGFDSEQRQQKASSRSGKTPINYCTTQLKKQAQSFLLSKKGIFHRKKRSVDVESVFGMLKENKSFRRFKLCGLQKVSIEFGLLALAHNLAKLSKILQMEDFFRLFYYLSYFSKHRMALLKLSL